MRFFSRDWIRRTFWSSLLPVALFIRNGTAVSSRLVGKRHDCRISALLSWEQTMSPLARRQRIPLNWTLNGRAYSVVDVDIPPWLPVARHSLQMSSFFNQCDVWAAKTSLHLKKYWTHAVIGEVEFCYELISHLAELLLYQHNLVVDTDLNTVLQIQIFFAYLLTLWNLYICVILQLLNCYLYSLYFIVHI